LWHQRAGDVLWYRDTLSHDRRACRRYAAFACCDARANRQINKGFALRAPLRLRSISPLAYAVRSINDRADARYRHIAAASPATSALRHKPRAALLRLLACTLANIKTCLALVSHAPAAHEAPVQETRAARACAISLRGTVTSAYCASAARRRHIEG